jgi:hypothetical protein
VAIQKYLTFAVNVPSGDGIVVEYAAATAPDLTDTGGLPVEKF